MTAFADNTWFEVHTCCKCGMAFAMTKDYDRKRRDDHGMFYCPAGHAQHYTGPTEAQKLKAELERRNEVLLAAELRAEASEKDRQQITRAHLKMRQRVVNGVCPCCNRTFGNLMQHMKTEHPDFASVQTMAMLRKAFGMSQAAVAAEAGVEQAYVSMYEREKHITPRIKQRLDAWVERHQASEAKAT